MKIRSHLALMATAILVPVVVFSAVALKMLRDDERQAALRGLNETVRATALKVDRELAGSVAALELLAASPFLENDDLQGFYSQAELLNKGDTSWTVLMDEDGNQLVNTSRPFGARLPHSDASAMVEEVMRMQRPVASDLLRSPITDQLITRLYVPVRAHSGRRYVLAQTYSVDFFTQAAFQREAPPGWIVAVLDREGRFIARNHRGDELVGTPARPELTEAIRVQAEGMIRHKTLEGVDSYDAFTRSSVAGWSIAIAAPVRTIEGSAARAVAVASMGLLVAIAFAVVAAAVFSGRLVRAIGQAADSAVALGQGERPAPATSAVVELAKLHSALTEAGDLLGSEKASRQKAEAELERLLRNEYQARMRAEADNMAKDQFLAMLGHELRNPMAAISGAIALSERAGHASAAAEDARRIIQRQSAHLSRIIDDLLDVSRLTSGKITINKQPLDLGHLAEACVASLRATGRTTEYTLRCEADSVWVEGDQTRLEQVVGNMLVNALKFTPPGGSITLQVKADGEDAVLILRDSGVGIPADLLPHVFEVFVQGPASLDRTQGGMGLGLALVRQLIDLHGGSVHAQSDGAGQGSTFIIRLPRVAAAEAQPTPVPDVEAVKQRILLIEDNTDARRMMAQLLEMEGHHVFEAGTAADGLRLAEGERPDLAVVDIGLAEMTGYEIARYLRAAPDTRPMGLIALTGYGQEEDRQNALAAGFDHHLVKPVEVENLLHMISICGAAARQRRNPGPASAEAPRSA